ncbi:hypothetical protein [Blastococcus sp. PRF04-17]|uniref:hypothetical protein n=1 Tax=Blastococcus sp. PRF04-17 TaxID=2933797 RepID=UPI001FF682DC|nr:hypothetical protein [Blastococcus sp. PRF04-17]UOY00431.1 hypothetical protein MVA48_15685 [Blastococcus sp. PRF04-17]
MRKDRIAAGVVGLSLAVTVPKMAAPAPALDPVEGRTDVVAALDMFLDLGPVKGEARRPGVRPRRDR